MTHMPTLLVFSAHAADFVWRAGGTIALHASRGYLVKILLDITPAWEKKLAAMESMEAQSHLVAYCSDLSRRRGSQAVRNSGRQGILHAEAFQRVFPQVTSELT